LPDNVVYLGAGAFSFCYDLSNVTLGSSLDEISDGCFASCSSLESIELNEGIVRIGVQAFEDNTSLQTIVIPDSTVEIGEKAFYSCTALSKIELGSSLSKVSNIAFAGIVFENSRGTPITGKYLNNVAIKRCAIKNTGGAAININYSQNCTIAGCDVSYCLAGGIIASGGNHMKLEKSGIVIRNNHIHNYALGELTYCGAVKINGCGTKIINNTIHDGPHGAIFFGGKENEISYNEIHSVCLDSGEMGAIYTGRDWTLCGNVINANFIHDIYNPRPQRNRAIMLDDGCAGITMTSNIFLRVAEAISLSAIGNVIENNIFVDNHPAISCWQKWEKQEDYTNPRYTHTQLLTILESHKPQEEPWKSKYPYLAMIDDAIKTGKMRDPATRTKIANNLIYSSTTNWCQFMTSRYKYTPETWLLKDNHQVTESVFMNPAKDDYRVKPSADVLKEGFKQLPDVTQIGVYDSKERFSWPVSHPVTVKCNSFTFKKK
jgi:hypothetical protein